MFSLVSRSRSYNAWERELEKSEEFVGPTCRRIRKFIEEANKRQTFFANCEGSYRRRADNLNDIKIIEQFIKTTVSCEELEESKELAEQMIRESVRYGNRDEIHYAVVWVYYFDYETEETMSTPLFKVFKGRNTTEATFVGMDLSVYSNWDEFLDKGRLPKSFVCVPRRGSYVFDRSSEKLDLIYVRSQSLWFHPIMRRSYQPYCQSIFSKMLSWIRSATEKIVGFVKYSVSVVCDVWNDKKKRKTCILFAVGLASACVMFCTGAMTPTDAIFNVISSAKMLLDVNVKPDNAWDVVNEQMLTLNPTLGILSKGYDAIENAIEKDWDGVFSSLKSIVVEHRTAFLLNSLPISPNVKSLLNTMLGFVELTGNSLKNNKEGGVNSTATKKRTNDAAKSVNRERIEEFLEAMQEKSGDKMAEEIAEEANSNEGLPYIPVTSDFPGRIYVFRRAYYSAIYEGLNALFRDFRILPRNSMVHDVTDAHENVIATLYFVDENSAYLWMSRNYKSEQCDELESTKEPDVSARALYEDVKVLEICPKPEMDPKTY